ncbi:hypothetical protein DFP78_108109 [Photobacterium lutimaris]|nr:hypothetical protein DFP78_108109 [Photobacterium lutimaris]
MILMLFLLIIFFKLLKLMYIDCEHDISVQVYELSGLYSPKAVQADHTMSCLGDPSPFLQILASVRFLVKTEGKAVPVGR